MNDSLHHKQLRAGLAESLRSKKMLDAEVVDAIQKVPRHLFSTQPVSDRDAYADKPLDIGRGQTMSQPYTVAYQTSLLQLHRNEKVLEIGTGSGYQAAVLHELGANVFSMERHKDLFMATKQKLASLGYSQIKLFYGDGNEGLEHEAPFDKILITAAAPTLPLKLLGQLKTGGIMVLPLGDRVQKMTRVTKLSDSEVKTEMFDEFLFVPFLPGTSGE
jgi:protein-L-isoaspartate(D-aspartate) O-methyltransferase